MRSGIAAGGHSSSSIGTHRLPRFTSRRARNAHKRETIAPANPEVRDATVLRMLPRNRILLALGSLLIVLGIAVSWHWWRNRV